MARQRGPEFPEIRGQTQSPVIIDPVSIEALVNGLVASLPAAVGAAVDNRLQGRKLLREISGKLDEISGKLDRMNENLSGKLDASGREHAELLKAVRES